MACTTTVTGVGIRSGSPGCEADGNYVLTYPGIVTFPVSQSPYEPCQVYRPTMADGSTIGFDRFTSIFSVVYSSDCNTVQPNESYDCINGGCIPKATYSTPGVFASLAACQSGCAKNSNCAGECVSAAELAALQAAAGTVRSRLCK